MIKIWLVGFVLVAANISFIVVFNDELFFVQWFAAWLFLQNCYQGK